MNPKYTQKVNNLKLYNQVDSYSCGPFAVMNIINLLNGRQVLTKSRHLKPLKIALKTIPSRGTKTKRTIKYLQKFYQVKELNRRQIRNILLSNKAHSIKLLVVLGYYNNKDCRRGGHFTVIKEVHAKSVSFVNFDSKSVVTVKHKSSLKGFLSRNFSCRIDRVFLVSNKSFPI
jgi:predicted double-glycine peptidase